MSPHASDRKLDALEQLRADPQSDATLEALRKALRDRSSLVVAKAARLAAEFRLPQLLPDLTTAFDRLMMNAARADPQCWGKTAIVKAMKALGPGDAGVFLRGASHFQHEPVWGGTEDTATALRSACAAALVESGLIARDTVLAVLVDLLADPEVPVRIDAARGLACMAGLDAALLLRLKIRLGDHEPEITGECFRALLSIVGNEGVPVVGGYLRSKEPDIRVEAASALGESRQPDAVALLKTAWNDESDGAVRKAILLALAASRQPEAIDFLIELVGSGERGALTALAVLRGSDEIRRRVADAVRSAGDPKFEAEFEREFPTEPEE